MFLRPLDLVVIGAYLVIALGIGLWSSRRAGKSGEAYFVADRSLPGWLVGISIVATTFAADTPLVVSGMVASKGIAANWFWWSMGIAHVGMFLFWSRLWRRAHVVTDAEFATVRYGGRAGESLRIFKALFFSVVWNAIVLGWVLRAMQKISAPFVRWEDWLPHGLWARLSAHWDPSGPLGGLDELLTIVVLLMLATLYSTLGGLRGVILTDLLQFLLAMIGAFALAGFVLVEVGGPSGLVSSLYEVLGAERAAETLAFVPPRGGLSFLSLQAFAVYLFLFWWSHPMGDGGGYIAQRLSAARSPRDAQVAAGVFLVLHYVVRPWPWIVVGLAGLVLFPSLELVADPAAHGQLALLVASDPEMAYPVLAARSLPPGLLGVLLASLFAAFMSTVDTHLNWSVSYVAHDLWANRIRPGCSPREEVLVGRVASVVFAVLALLVATRIGSVEKAWKFVAALGAGMGLPVLLRWVWWRVNAQAEIGGALGSFLVTLLITLFVDDLLWEYTLALSVAGGVSCALLGVLLFGPADPEVLDGFWTRVRPPGFWGPVRARSATPGSALAVTGMVGAWLAAALALICLIFAPGHLVLGRYGSCLILVGLAILLGGVARRFMHRQSPSDVALGGPGAPLLPTQPPGGG